MTDGTQFSITPCSDGDGWTITWNEHAPDVAAICRRLEAAQAKPAPFGAGRYYVDDDGIIRQKHGEIMASEPLTTEEICDRLNAYNDGARKPQY